MQERVVEREAERAEPSWYLTRDGQQHGPLTDKELSLFAEGGNFKPGDLLWTAGLDEWKPAEAMFGPESSLGPDAAEPDLAEPEVPEPGGEAPEGTFGLPLSPETDAADGAAPDAEFSDAVFGHDTAADEGAQALTEPNGEDLNALVQALTGSVPESKPTLKDWALEEIKKFVPIFAYLWVVFMVLLLLEWIVLSENHIGFRFYGLAVINALVLGKIMLVAEHFRFAEQLNHKPLAYPIAYKAMAFTTLLFLTYILEEMVVGWIGGHGFLASVPRLGGSLIGTVLLWLIFCVALIPFFAFKELQRAVGPDAFQKLLFGRG
jgi:uncharacterized protein DUF4339